jgi:xanthine/uracil permease
VLFGTAVIGSVSFRKPLFRLVGVLVSFIFGGWLVVALAMTVMHSPPVHEDLLYVIFLSSLGLLFYLGYTFAIWRQQGSGHDDAN